MTTQLVINASLPLFLSLIMRIRVGWMVKVNGIRFFFRGLHRYLSSGLILPSDLE